MKEHPILFSTDMVKAILEDRKTMTRRIVNPQPVFDEDSGRVFSGHVPAKRSPFDIHNWKEPFAEFFSKTKPGDAMWVRETWSPTINIPETKNWYKASADEVAAMMITWKPSIFMLKEDARIWLEAISEKVERIAEISDEDCIREGILFYDDDILEERRYKDYFNTPEGFGHPDFDYLSFDNPREFFRSLWQKINGKPKPVQKKVNGKLKTVGYIVYPFDAEAGKEFKGKKTWRGKPLTVVINPVVRIIEFNTLSKTGKP